MANLLTSRIGRGDMRRRPRRQPTESVRVAGLQGQAIAQAGRNISAVGRSLGAKADAYARRKEARVAAEEYAQYTAGKLSLIAGYEAEQRESGELDTDGELWAAYVKENSPDIFSHFTSKAARERANNDWLVSSTAAGLEYAADDRLREADQAQNGYLFQMNEMAESTEPLTATMVTERLNGIQELSNDAEADGRFKAFQDPSVNKVRLEELSKKVVGQYLLDQAGSDKNILDSANEVVADLYGDDLPKAFKFTTQEVADLKKQQQQQETDIKRESENFVSSLITDALKKGQTMSTNEFKEQLRQTQGLTPDIEDDVLAAFLGSRSKWQTTGSNPWTSTHNHPALHAMHQRFRFDNTVTHAELDEAWRKGDILNWSLNEQESFRDQIDKRDEPVASGDFRYSDPVVKSLTDRYDALWGTREEHAELSGEDWDKWSQGRIDLISDFKGVYPDTAAMREKYNSRTQSKREEEAGGWLSKLVGVTAQGVVPGPVGTFAKAVDVLISPSTPPIQITPETTQAEFDALPPGTEYLRPNDDRVWTK